MPQVHFLMGNYGVVIEAIITKRGKISKCCYFCDGKRFKNLILVQEYIEFNYGV